MSAPPFQHTHTHTHTHNTHTHMLHRLQHTNAMVQTRACMHVCMPLAWHTVFAPHLERMAHSRPELNGLGELHREGLAGGLFVLDLERLVSRDVLEHVVLHVLGPRRPIPPFQLIWALNAKPAHMRKASEGCRIAVGERGAAQCSRQQGPSRAQDGVSQLLPPALR